MKKIESDVKSEAIRNRDSWLKIFIILLFSFLITWKLLTSSININLSDFNFADLLSLILALFAVALSVTFYFKAIETSNDFYNNTYKFTNEMSEILGRIEAGFGERLRHLDEGYIGLRDKFDKFPIDIYKVEEQVKVEEEEVKKKLEERNKIIESLANKAKLQENEKSELFSKLQGLEIELNDAKSTMSLLQGKLKKAEINDFEDFDIPDRMRNYIQYDLTDLLGSNVKERDINQIKNRFDSLKEEIYPGFLKDMQHFGYTDSENNLTEIGAITIKHFMRLDVGIN